MSSDSRKLFITPGVISQYSLGRDYFSYLQSRFDLRIADHTDISEEEFRHYATNCFGILATGSDIINEEVIKAAGSNLKVVSLTSSGYDKIDVKALKSQAVRIGTSGKIVANATAEFAMTLLLAASRKLVTFNENYKKNPIVNISGRIATLGLEESTIGIVGAGRVGESIAKKLAGFNISQLLYHSRSPKPAIENLGGVISSFEKIAEKCDYIILTLPLTNETYHIINKDILNMMKPNVIIVNIGRGKLIDHDALAEALQSKRIGGAALDVTDPEPLPENHLLLHQDNVVLAPHVGSCTITVKKNLCKHAVENILAVAENREMPEELII